MVQEIRNKKQIMLTKISYRNLIKTIPIYMLSLASKNFNQKDLILNGLSGYGRKAFFVNTICSFITNFLNHLFFSSLMQIVHKLPTSRTSLWFCENRQCDVPCFHICRPLMQAVNKQSVSGRLDSKLSAETLYSLPLALRWSCTANG